MKSCRNAYTLNLLTLSAKRSRWQWPSDVVFTRLCTAGTVGSYLARGMNISSFVSSELHVEEFCLSLYSAGQYRARFLWYPKVVSPKNHPLILTLSQMNPVYTLTCLVFRLLTLDLFVVTSRGLVLSTDHKLISAGCKRP
jgi:hypothetical protein